MALSTFSNEATTPWNATGSTSHPFGMAKDLENPFGMAEGLEIRFAEITASLPFLRELWYDQALSPENVEIVPLANLQSSIDNWLFWPNPTVVTKYRRKIDGPLFTRVLKEVDLEWLDLTRTGWAYTANADGIGATQHEAQFKQSNFDLAFKEANCFVISDDKFFVFSK
jgi:hypothetical protein